MKYILAYTKPGIGVYDYTNYPGREKAYNCDWEHAMHLAISDDGKNYTALRNNTGILFPKATFTEGKPQGTTKTLQYPWIFRMADGTFGVSAVRRNQNAPDPLTVGCMMRFTSENLVRYEEAGFLKLSDGEITNPRCVWEEDRDAYYVEWNTEDGLFCGYTKYFMEIRDKAPCAASKFEAASDYGIEGAIPGNVIEVTDEEADVIRKHFDVIYNVGAAPAAMEVEAGKAPCFDSLPRVTMLYSDGSTHDKIVNWDKDEFDKIDFSKPGEYEIPGEVYYKRWPFPIPLSPVKNAPPWMRGGMSDPCVVHHEGKYYLTSSGGTQIIMRVSDTLEGVFSAPPIAVYEMPLAPGQERVGTWAAELHFIKGVAYIFTGVCPGSWVTVQSHVLRCNGDPSVPENWEAPRLSLKPNGRVLTEGGISLDMTYFCVEGVHYVMWSDRKIDTTVEPEVPEPADVYIATIDPDAPWQTTSEPQCVLRPIYGWDRYETEVDEGPFILRHGDDIFITISGSSTGLADLYDLGFLHAKVGNNLLCMDGWDWIPYPFLTKESVENEYGPGHNSFVKDPENGDDLMVYHAVPHDENGKTMGRRPGIRRVHWASTGLPYLEMTEERDLDPKYKNITLKVTVK